MTPRADEVVLRELRIGLLRPFRTSRVTTTERRICVLEFREHGETRGWSECVAGEAPDYTAETVDTAWHALENWLLPAVVGRSFRSLDELEGTLDFVRGHRMAKAAVETGFRVMAAAERGLSLAKSLGGGRERVPTGASLGLGEDPDRIVALALRAVDEGYARIKMKIAPGRDYDAVRLVRDAVGPEVPLAADANGAYGEADSAELRRLDELSLLFLEQPFAPDDWLAHARLQERMATPICLDESIETAEQLAAASALGACRMVNIKPGRVGGLGAAVRLHDACAERGIPVFCGGMFETGIGRACNRALASLPNFSVPGDLYPVSGYLESDIVRSDVRVVDGSVEVPGGPGLGVEVDAGRVDELTVRSARVA
ncbi:MAG: o-succinylbenzoate synthase [Gemmatimonadota bacterium]